MIYFKKGLKKKVFVSATKCKTKWGSGDENKKWRVLMVLGDSIDGILVCTFDDLSG